MQVELDPSTRAVLLQLRRQADARLTIPGFRGELEPHQRVAIWFALLAQRCLLCADVGLGKTIMSIGLIMMLIERQQAGRVLILCQSGKRFDWFDELLRFSGLTGRLVDGNRAERHATWLMTQTPGVTIASYESFRDDTLQREKLPDGTVVYNEALLSKRLRFDTVIFDEVTVFKTWGTVLHQALTQMVINSWPTYAIGLSATPIQKSGDDLYSILDKVRPGWLGQRDWFRDTFLTFRDRGTKREKVTGIQHVQQLAERVAPVLLMREKNEVYPDRIVHRTKLRRLPLTTRQRELYDYLVDQTTHADRDRLMARFQLLEKAVDTTAYFDQEGPDGTKPEPESAKLADLRQLLTGDLINEKVVVFSKHKLPLQETIRHVLEPEKIGYILFTGEERNLRKRNDSRHRFQSDPACRVALVTTAAEMGYDFDAAAYLVFLNSVYNPARMNQLRGRIDRPITQKAGLIYTIHYVMSGTFEEYIIPNLHRESEVARHVLGQTNRFSSLNRDLMDDISNDDLFALIKGRYLPERRGV